jgi:hypothetical protein
MMESSANIIHAAIMRIVEDQGNARFKGSTISPNSLAAISTSVKQEPSCYQINHHHT